VLAGKVRLGSGAVLGDDLAIPGQGLVALPQHVVHLGGGQHGPLAQLGIAVGYWLTLS